MNYKVALRESEEEGYSVSCPALPGCWSQGDTEEEALDNIKIAIEEYLGVLDTQLEDAIVREVEVAA
jgi:predicted RNase H-like HicB family nuclease